MLSNRDTGDTRLPRTLGLFGATAIGVGTMIGAGIFVFPGLAADRAGVNAHLAFLIAGAVALLVSVCTAELATAMPENGGVYYYARRLSGRRWAAVVGLSQWLGLIFATAFYLSGFVEYSERLLTRGGWPDEQAAHMIIPVVVLSILGVNTLGANWFGRVQNLVVAGLLLLLLLFIGAGIATVFDSETLPEASESGQPAGFVSLATTAALVFTSFLGFVQIATVGGEITSPAKNLPRALLGSVVIVTAVYVATLYVATAVSSPATMADAGATAMITASRQVLGPMGATTMLGAGLLATLSSANASVLSGSRALHALSVDGLAPKLFARVHQRFGSPHRALAFTGIPAGAIALLGPVEILAQVASSLHLFLYFVLCIAVVWLRWESPDWYQPKFRVPAGSLTALGAGACCLVVIYLMDVVSIGIAIGCMLGGGLASWLHSRFVAYNGNRDDPSVP